MVLPSAWNTGSAASKSAFSPPTMMDSAASMAPFSPPETGASSMRTPFAARALPTFCETSGEIVDMSAKSCPRLTPSIRPSLPSATSSTSGEFGSMVMTHVGLGRDVPRAGGRLGPRADQLLNRPLAPAVDNQWISGLEQVLGHGTAHNSKPNESNDLRHGDLVGTGLGGAAAARRLE